MRKIMFALSAAALAVPTLTIPASPAEAQYRTWRGKDGRVYCKRPNGTTGLIVGGAVGALAGRAIERSRSRQRCVRR